MVLIDNVNALADFFSSSWLQKLPFLPLPELQKLAA